MQRKRKAKRCPLCGNWRHLGTCELCRRYQAQVKYEDSKKGKARKEAYRKANPKKFRRWKNDWRKRQAESA